MRGAPDTSKARACPCGEEPIDVRLGQHIIGPNCQALVIGQVRRRFGAHRYGGRLAHDVEDIVQECYKKLLAPGGLDSFRPPPARPLAVAFRAWLFGVVKYHCHNKWRDFRRRNRVTDNPKPTSGAATDAEPLASTVETPDVVTPESEWARDWLRALAEGAVADVEVMWTKKGGSWSDRFHAVLPIAVPVGEDYANASATLGIPSNHARQLVFGLRGDLRKAGRARVEDELSLEPGLSRASIEAKITEAIRELLDAAFPGGHGLRWDFFAAEEEPEAAKEPERQRNDAPPESKP